MYKITGASPSPFYENMMVYYILCDTPNDLPSTISNIGYGTEIGYGSRADIISNSSKYLWNGSQWVLQKSVQEIEISADDIVYDNTDSGLTATNVQDAIDEIKDLDDMQDRGLAELYAENTNQQLEIDYAINTGAKNMLYISNTPGYTATSHGRTFTVLSDGGIKITGASSDSSNADFYIIGSWNNRSILLNENRDSCLMSMKCDTDYGYNQIRLRAMNRSTGSTVNDTGVETNKDVRLSHVITTVFVSVFPSVTLPEDGIVIYPMIRRAEITDDTYVPYAKTNRDLTVAENEDRSALINQVDSGAKNLVNLNTSFTTHTHKGITYTNNGDGTINVSGTSNATDSYVTLYDRNENNLFGVQIGETVVLRSTSNTVSLNLIYKKQGGGYGLTVYGYKDTPATFTIPTDFVGFLLRIGVPNNGTTVNENVGAMICTAADYAISPAYVPYAPTNRELYEMILALQSGRSIQSVNQVSTLNLSRNDLNEQLDTNFDLIDSIQEEEEGEEDD